MVGQGCRSTRHELSIFSVSPDVPDVAWHGQPPMTRGIQSMMDLRG